MLVLVWNAAFIDSKSMFSIKYIASVVTSFSILQEPNKHSTMTCTGQCCTRCWPNVDPVHDDCAVCAGKAYIIVHQRCICGGYTLIQLRMLIFHVHLFVKQIFTTMFYNFGHAVCTLLRISNESAPSVDYYVDIYMNMSVIIYVHT